MAQCCAGAGRAATRNSGVCGKSNSSDVKPLLNFYGDLTNTGRLLKKVIRTLCALDKQVIQNNYNLETSHCAPCEAYTTFPVTLQLAHACQNLTHVQNSMAPELLSHTLNLGNRLLI